MVYCDIDGVLRDLCGAAGINPVTWDCKIGSEELSFTKYFSANRELLVLAKPTEYLRTLQHYHECVEEIILLSSQPKSWQELTQVWVEKYFDRSVIILYTTDKLKYLVNKNDVLIEDSPHLSDYSQVIVIDRPYNRTIKLPHFRVRNSAGLLFEMLRRFHEFTKKDNSDYSIFSR